VSITNEQLHEVHTHAVLGAHHSLAHCCLMALGLGERGAGGQLWPTTSAEARQVVADALRGMDEAIATSIRELDPFCSDASRNRWLEERYGCDFCGKVHTVPVCEVCCDEDHGAHECPERET
jgi:hypothetical protein